MAINFKSRQRASALLIILVFALSACGSSGSNSNNSSAPTQAAPDALHIKFLYSSEKQPWVESITRTFNTNQVKAPSGKPIYVDLEAIGSGESVTNILSGKSQPNIWSPASNIWIPLLNDGWQSQKNTQPLIDTTTQTCKSVVISPVVVMMWKQEAQVLGWPDKPISWVDIANLSTTPNGWADAPYSKPQLGEFRFGHTHPDYSNSGFEMLLAMAYAAAKPARVLTVADVQKPETGAFINKLESAVAHYGSSTGFFGDAMIKRGPTYLSAAVVYESVVVGSYDANGQSKNLDDSLVAIYPTEGTFLSDHPVCIPNGSWNSPDQKAAAATYLNFMLGKDAQNAALSYGFRPADPSIAIGAPIDLAHGVNPKEPQNVLQVPDAATIRAVRDLWQTQKRQVNLTLVMDISGSMADDGKIAGARDGAKAFVDQLDDTATLSLIVFDDHIKTVFDTIQVGPNRDMIKQNIGLLTPGGGTALYDTVAFSAQCMAGLPPRQPITEVASSPKCGKPDPKKINSVVLMTDGMDTNSTTYKNVTDLMHDIGRGNESTSDISIFTIGYGKDADASVLGTIAQGAGGEYAVAPTAADIGTVYRDIATFF